MYDPAVAARRHGADMELEVVPGIPAIKVTAEFFFFFIPFCSPEEFKLNFCGKSFIANYNKMNRFN